MENLSTPQPNSNKPAENTAQNLVLPIVGQQLTYPLDYTTQEILRDFVSRIQVQAFPVGSIFISVDSTNPATTLGYGTWVAFGAGRTLVGFDSGDALFDTVEETGGAKTHTLSDNELPVHSFNTVGAPGVSSSAWQTVAGNTKESIVGGGASFDIMNPFITVYMWKRQS